MNALRPVPLPLRRLALLAAAAPIAARAQAEPPEIPRYARAFEPSVSFTFGASSYGERLSVATRHFKPASSWVVAAWADRPLTRRTGLLLGVGLAPVSGRRIDTDPPNPTSLTEAGFMVATLDVGIAGRLKPSVPVFFMLSGGVLSSTKGVSPDAQVRNKWLLEPHSDFTIGIDGARRQRWGWRVLYVNRWAFPQGVDVADYAAPSTAHDWTFQVGARRALGDVRALGRGR